MTPNRKTSTPTLIFLHISKTAGTSFNTALSWQYFGQPSYWIPTTDHEADSFRKLSVKCRAELRLLRGHMQFGLHELLPQQSVYTTFIREPVARLFSYWHTLQKGARELPEGSDSWLAVVRSMTLEQYIEYGKDMDLDNSQVRRISGMKAPFGQCNRKMLEQARKNIAERFPVIGLTDRFDESLLLMRRAFGWKRPLLYSKSFVGEKRQDRTDPSEGLLKEIRRLNELDAELHLFAKAQFETQVKAASDWMETDLKRLRKLTRLWSCVIPVRRLARRLYTRKD